MARPLALPPLGAEIDAPAPALPPLGAEVDGPATPAAAPPAPPPEQLEAQRDEQLRSIFEAGLQQAPDARAGVLEISRRTGLQPDLVESQLPLLRQHAEASGFDPRRFREEAPGLADLLLEQPGPATVLLRDDGFRSGLKTLGEWVHQVLVPTAGSLQPSEDDRLADPALVEERARIAKAGVLRQLAPEEATKQIEALNLRIREQAGTKRAAAAKPEVAVVAPEAELEGLARVGIYGAAWRQSRQRSELNRLGSRLLFAEVHGDETWDLEKRIVQLQNEVGPRRSYRQGPVEQVLLDATEAIASQVDPLKGGGVGGAVGAAVTGVVVTAASKSAAAGRVAAKVGWKLGSRSGAFLASLEQETGSAYLELRDLKTDDGRLVDRDIARGASVVYGLAAAGVEVVALGPMLKSFGPLGAALAKGEGKVFLRTMLADRTMAEILRGAGKAWAKAAAAEGAEEAVQQTLQYLAGHASKRLTAGESQAFDLDELAMQAAEAAYKGALGGAVLGGAGAAVNVTTQAVRLGASERAAAHVETITGLAESPSVRASPELVARAVERETAASGEAVTHAYVDAAAFVRLFQSQNADPEAAARELLGEAGPQRLRDAQAGALGGRLEIPLAEYLERWGPKGVAEALAPDTTVRPGLLTPRELVEHQDEVRTKAEELKKTYLAENAPEPESSAEKRLVDVVQQQLARTGTYKAGDAKEAVALTRAFLRTQAEVAGVEPDALFEDYVITVAREVAGQPRPAEAAQREIAGLEDLAPETQAFIREAIGEGAPAAGVELARKAFLDTLTPAGNKAAYQDFLSRPRKGVHVAIDLNKFKSINDTFGHAVGDKAITAAGEAFAAASRAAGGKLFRPGGDEFTAHFDTVEQARAFVADANARFEQLPALEGGRRLSFSAGLAGDPKAADAVSYEAKRIAHKAADLLTAGRGYSAWDETNIQPEPVHVEQRLKQSGYPARMDTSSEEFRSWFGTSTVVNAKGEPLVVYAGLPRGIEEIPQTTRNELPFGYAFFTSDREVAARYAGSHPEERHGLHDYSTGRKGRTYRVFLKIEKPWNLDEELPSREWMTAFDEEPREFEQVTRGMEWDEDRGKLVHPFNGATLRDLGSLSEALYGEQIAGQGYTLEYALRDSTDGRLALLFPKAAARIAEGHGYDGVTFTDGEMGGTTYLPFEEDQIRLVDSFHGPAGGEAHEGGSGTARLAQQERGFVDMMREGLKRVFKVVLTDKADLSTFLHESAHVYLELLGDLAAREKAPERVRQDWQTTLEWLGAKDRGSLTREQHERWARAFEAYLMEGKAPTAQLAGAFQRFKLWLWSLYRQIPPEQLDDRIRGVFDRILATDEEIARMKTAMGADRAVFRSPDEAGMTPAQFEAYLADRERSFSRAALATQRRVLQEQTRVTEKWWKDETAKLEREARAEWDRRPDARAFVYLKRGELVLEDGRTVSDRQMGRLDRALVEKVYGKDPRLEKALAGRLVEDGEDPTEVARRYGFGTARELLQAIAALPDREEWAAAEAERRMRDRHPDVLAERARLAELAASALHAEGTADWLLKEAVALRSRAQQGVGTAGKQIPVEAIREAARQIADAQSVRVVSPHRALQAERRAAEEAFRAAAKGEYALAFVAKQKQLLNHYLFRELELAREDRDGFEDLAGKMAERKRREVLGKGGRVFLDAADSILEALGFKEPASPEEIADRATTPEWVKALEEAGIVPGFAAARISEIVARPPASWKDLSVGDVRMLGAALAQLYTAARDMHTVVHLGKRVGTAQLAGEIAAEAARLPAKEARPGSDTAAPRSYWAKQRIAGFSASLVDPQQILEDLGPTAARFFWRGYTAQRTIEDDLTRKVSKFFGEKWDALPKALAEKRYELLDPQALALVPFPEDLGRDGSLRDRQWAWMLALNMGNRSNMDRLLGGYDWSEENVRTFLDQVLTDEEWTFLESVWELLDRELYPEVAKAYEAVNGIKPQKIEAVPFTLSSGRVIRGGYFPARYDPVASRVGADQSVEAITKLYAQKAGAFSVAKSFTKERVKEYSDVVNLQWAFVPSHVANVIHYVAFDRFVRDAARLLNHPEVQRTVENGPRPDPVQVRVIAGLLMLFRVGGGNEIDLMAALEQAIPETLDRSRHPIDAREVDIGNHQDVHWRLRGAGQCPGFSIANVTATGLEDDDGLTVTASASAVAYALTLARDPAPRCQPRTNSSRPSTCSTMAEQESTQSPQLP